MYCEKSTSLIVRLKDDSDAKVDGRSFHTFTTLSAKKIYSEHSILSTPTTSL